jgi:hypothetical protein
MEDMMSSSLWGQGNQPSNSSARKMAAGAITMNRLNCIGKKSIAFFWRHPMMLWRSSDRFVLLKQ